ncbi:hypothetical protein [Natrinema sp. SYSU A 869]|uniref:hypothetical protein n=1 Tax=Natrinema sp. SYSU A 869 TaxID=2871694 RepID=UPI001CA3E424|nr:hypothetical protein [Natrinema sp. SYSU A 869]
MATDTSLIKSLPDVAADPLENATPDEAEQFSLAEFAERIDVRTDTTIDDAIGPIELARSAVTSVGDIVETELKHTREQLPASSSSSSNLASR